jgi:ABC-type lipoprotein export system ATPase subunit
VSALLEARGLVRVLGRGELEQRVLFGVSVQIDRGEFVALTGPSGSGKSTLLYLLGALDQPDEGEVLFDGKSLTTMGEEERATFRGRHLGYVFQFHFLLPEFDVLENVAVPMLRQGWSDADATARATAALEELGLAELRRRRPGQLSGGQQQRVAIARAIAHRPDLILADEPTGALDSKNAATVVAALRHLSSTRKTTIVMVTHDSELAAVCDRRVTLADGVVAQDSKYPREQAAPSRRDLSSLASDMTGEHLAAMIQLAEEADAQTVVMRRDELPHDPARSAPDGLFGDKTAPYIGKRKEPPR